MDAKVKKVIGKFASARSLPIPVPAELMVPFNVAARYDSDSSFLIPMLQDIQKEFNYLPRESLSALSTVLEVPVSQIYGITTFYKAFSLTPQGRHKLSLCMGTACHVRGAQLLNDHVGLILNLKPGETSPDLEITFETVNCLGACALGPIVVADGEYNGNMTVSKLNHVIKAFRIGTKALKKQKRSE